MSTNVLLRPARPRLTVGDLLDWLGEVDRDVEVTAYNGYELLEITCLRRGRSAATGRCDVTIYVEGC